MMFNVVYLVTMAVAAQAAGEYAVNRIPADMAERNGHVSPRAERRRAGSMTLWKILGLDDHFEYRNTVGVIEPKNR